MDNIYDPDIIGGRLCYKPLSLFGIPIYKDLEIGYTAIIDTDPQNPLPNKNYPYLFEDSLNTANNYAYIYSYDIKLPIYGNNYFDVGAFYEKASQYQKGSGFLIGIYANLLNVIPLKFETRLLNPGFISDYFDAFYEVRRNTLLDSLGYTIAKTNSTQILTSFGLNLFDKLITTSIDYEYFFEKDPITNKLTIRVYFSKEWSKLIGFKLVYFRKNLPRIQEITDFDNPDCFLFWLLDFHISDFLIFNIGFNKSYILDENRKIKLYVGSVFTTTIIF